MFMHSVSNLMFTIEIHLRMQKKKQQMHGTSQRFKKKTDILLPSFADQFANNMDHIVPLNYAETVRSERATWGLGG